MLVCHDQRFLPVVFTVDDPCILGAVFEGKALGTILVNQDSGSSI